jgi:L-tartrate/succinate antiporter
MKAAYTSLIPWSWWRALTPVLISAVVALCPAPPDLPVHAWYYFAIFLGVIAALVGEPLPSPAIGIIAIALVATLSRWVLFTPAQLADPHFNISDASLNWAMAGFGRGITWLVFSAFMFTLGYEKTGLGRRLALQLVKRMGHNSLLLGYAIVITDALLAPVTPSNTARTAGTLFPIISSLPPLYDSRPHDVSARRIGGYLMWTSFAASAVTSSMFMTACAPNLLAVELVHNVIHVDITWQRWFLTSAPLTVPLLFALPVLVYLIYPPQIRYSARVTQWAAAELSKMGPMSRHEMTLCCLMLLAVALWIFAHQYLDAGTSAWVVIALMLLLRVLIWNDIASHTKAWTTLVLVATLVTLADGLSDTGFIPWFARHITDQLSGLSPSATISTLVAVYFLSHYLFASLTAHTSALLPVMLAVGTTVPNVPPEKLGLALAITTGLMGVITPYATGPGMVYYESGYLPAADFWRLGAVFGALFLGAYLLIAAPLLMAT